MRFKVDVKQADRFLWMRLFRPNAGQNEGDTRIGTVAGAYLTREFDRPHCCCAIVVLSSCPKKCSAGH